MLKQLAFLVLLLTSVASAVHSGSGIAVDASGRVYFADTARNVVWRIEADGKLTAVERDVHTNVLEVGPDGSIRYPEGGYAPGRFTYIVETPEGGVYATLGSRVVRVLPDSTLVIVAGDTARGYSDGPATTARFNRPQGIAIDSEGNVYVADHGNRGIRRITAAGQVTTVARTGWPWTPVGLAVWRDRIYSLERFGNYFGGPPFLSVYADIVGHPRVRVILADGDVQTVARVVDPRERLIAVLVIALALATLTYGVVRRRSSA